MTRTGYSYWNERQRNLPWSTLHNL